MVDSELTGRRRQVLQAVLDDYIRTAEPVGSRVVAKRHHLGLSPATIRNTMADLEVKGELVNLLTLHAESPGVQVLIGWGNPFEALQDFSLVTSTYSVGDRVLGILGVVGPRRMPYAEIVSLVEETAELMSQWLRRVTEAERARVRVSP